jgi:hypothetical protein
MWFPHMLNWWQQLIVLTKGSLELIWCIITQGWHIAHHDIPWLFIQIVSLVNNCSWLSYQIHLSVGAWYHHQLLGWRSCNFLRQYKIAVARLWNRPLVKILNWALYRFVDWRKLIIVTFCRYIVYFRRAFFS